MQRDFERQIKEMTEQVEAVILKVRHFEVFREVSYKQLHSTMKLVSGRVRPARLGCPNTYSMILSLENDTEGPIYPTFVLIIGEVYRTPFRENYYLLSLDDNPFQLFFIEK